MIEATTPQHLARSMRSIAADTKDPGDQAQLFALAQRFDDFFSAVDLPPSAPGMGLNEIWLWQCCRDLLLMVGIIHGRIQALEAARSIDEAQP
jgi:hypothetical protein